MVFPYLSLSSCQFTPPHLVSVHSQYSGRISACLQASLAERLETARRASNPTQQGEHAEVAAGAAGEKQFLERFRSDLGNAQKNYFFERRVPSSRRSDRRREIDVVVVTYQVASCTTTMLDNFN